MIKTVFIFTCVGLTMLLLTPVGLATALLGLVGFRRLMSVLMYRIAQGWARLTIIIIGCKLTVTGRENVPRKGGVCFVSNHGSIVDILMLLAYAGRPIGFVAKKELLLIPILNMWIIVLGGLFIDRKSHRKAHKTISTGVARLKASGGMIIFPEGHRSRGKGLLPFHPGAFKLATQSGATIVPVALAGTYDIFERNYRAYSGPVRITFCPPVNTSDIPATDRKQILSDRVYAVIKEALDVGTGE